VSEGGGPGGGGYVYRNRAGRCYYLRGKTVTLQNGRRKPIYWLARAPHPGEALAAVPPGYEIREQPRTGRPYLKRVSGPG
jgi:hypothetical protein